MVARHFLAERLEFIVDERHSPHVLLCRLSARIKDAHDASPHMLGAHEEAFAHLARALGQQNR